MIDILVVSHACLTAVNRAPYRRLRDMGWAIEIVTAESIDSHDIRREADPQGPDDPPMHFLPLRGGNMRFWRFAGLRPLLDRLKPRIVMVDYDPGTRIALETGGWARRNSARVACLSYDNIPRRPLAELRRSPAAGARALLVQAMSRLARRLVDHVFVLSGDSERVMRGFGFGERVSRIPLGFDPAKFRVDPSARTRVRTELGLSDVTFAYFGRLIPEKGAHLLLEALHRLRDRRWQLLMDRFSDYRHPYTREVAALIERLGLGDRVVYFDASHDEIGDYMNAADIVVMPSRSTDRWKEQYGRVAAEAMACGRLVIVSDSGALPELVGDGGIVVPEAELDDLDRVLARALDDERLRADYGGLGARHAEARLSLPVQCALMHERFSAWASPSRPSEVLAATTA
jgi:glycosyltransferase involved in cell wall biosynthesis